MKHLGVFAKYWQPGGVKTRLGDEIGMEKAANFYRLMLETTLRRCSSVGDLRTLVYSPPERGGDFLKIAGAEWNRVPQVGGDLGDRMSSFARDALSEETHRIVLLGSDCPHIPIGWIHDAFEHLGEYDVVLGPSFDGGYYLVGMSGSVPPIFDGIEWSTTRVFSQTVARLAERDLSFAVLGETFDIDDVTGLRQLDDHLRQVESDESMDALAGAITSILSELSNSSSQ